MRGRASNQQLDDLATYIPGLKIGPDGQGRDGRCPVCRKPRKIGVKKGDHHDVVWSGLCGCDGVAIRAAFITEYKIPASLLGTWDGRPSSLRRPDPPRAEPDEFIRVRAERDRLLAAIDDALACNCRIPAEVRIILRAAREGRQVPVDQGSYIRLAARAGVSLSASYEAWARYVRGRA